MLMNLVNRHVIAEAELKPAETYQLSTVRSRSFQPVVALL